MYIHVAERHEFKAPVIILSLSWTHTQSLLEGLSPASRTIVEVTKLATGAKQLTFSLGCTVARCIRHLCTVFLKTCNEAACHFFLCFTDYWVYPDV